MSWPTLYELFERAVGGSRKPATQDQPGGPAAALGGVADSVSKPAQAAPAAPAEDKYAAAVKMLVAHFKSKGTQYGHQTEEVTKGGNTWVQRKKDFLTDDALADCTKLVIKAMLDADEVDCSAGWEGLTVPAFYGAKVSDISAVGGMTQVIAGLVEAKKTTPIRAANPKVGDVIFWGGHVAMVTGVGSSESDTLVSFASMGVKGGANLYERVALEGNLRNDRIYGSGGFQGFWTPRP